jgi:hypothetical protein
MRDFLWYFTSYRADGLNYIDSFRLALELHKQENDNV